MEFLKNIDGEFIYTGNICEFLSYHNFNQNWKTEKLRVRVIDINMEAITFALVDYTNADELISMVVEKLLDKLKEDYEAVKSTYIKIINEWNNNPDSFVSIGDDFRQRYENKTLLTKDEYTKDSISVFFEKYHGYYSGTFRAGYGEFSFTSKEETQKGLDAIDDWYNKEVKNLKSSKLKTRFKNYINNLQFELTFKAVIKYITIPENKNLVNENKPAFPFQIDGRILNRLLSLDAGYIDEEFLKEYKEEYADDISFLEGCEIEDGTEGCHHHDGDVCDYEVVITLPDGTKYYAYDSHSLMTGYRFEGIVNFC